MESPPQTSMRLRLTPDLFVLLISWLILLWAALASWLRHDQFGLDSGLPMAIARALLYTHALIFAICACLPLMWWRSQGRIDTLMKRFRSGAAGWVMLNALTALMLYHAYAPPSRFRTFASFATGLVIALLLIWLFYQRETINWRQALLLGVWLVMLVFTLLTLRWWWRDDQPARIYLIIFTLAAGILIPAPLILSIRPVRGWLAARLAPITRAPLVVFVIALWLLLIVRLAVGILTDNPTHFTHSLTLIEVPIIGAFLIRLAGSRDELTTQRPLTDALFKRGLALIFVAYLIVGLLSIRSWVGAISVDGFAYLNIARSYASGDFVVRGLWSPLMSWLLAPFIALGGHPQVVQRTGVVLNGVLWIVFSGLLARRFRLSRLAQLGVMAAMAGFILRYSFWPITPDGLAAMVLAGYFVALTSDRIASRPLWQGVLVGGIGALAYYAKYYNIGFIPVHLILSGLLFWGYGTPPARVIKFVGTALATMALLIAPWVVLLSLRYGIPTASIAGSLNSANLNPARDPAIDNCASYPMCAKPDDVLFPWEDPDPVVYMPYARSPLRSWEGFALQVNIINVNLWIMAQDQGIEVGGMIPLALAAVGLSLMAMRLNPHRQMMAIWLIGTTGLYLAGHLSVTVGEFRYFYSLLPLGFIALYYCIDQALKHLQSADAPAQIIRLAAAALIVAPILFTDLRPTRYTPLFGPLRAASDCLEFDALAMREYIRAPMVGSTASHAISYYTQVRSYGDLEGVPDEVAATLREFGVRTYIVSASRDAALADSLIRDYGFTLEAEMPYCNQRLLILAVTDP